MKGDDYMREMEATWCIVWSVPTVAIILIWPESFTFLWWVLLLGAWGVVMEIRRKLKVAKSENFENVSQSVLAVALFAGPSIFFLGLIAFRVVETLLEN
jgi:hypothetical protein